MKKLLLFLVFGVMIAGIVMATPQKLIVNIGDDIVIAITPDMINFSSVMPGTDDNPAINGPIKFNATGSNTNVTIEVTNVTGVPFEDGLELDGANPIGRTFHLDCVTVDYICTYSIVSTVPTLNVPKGLFKGMKEGNITYTITGDP